MATPARRLIAPFLLAASFAHTVFGQVPGRDVVGPARDLYASARYDEALAVLNDLRPADAGDRRRRSQVDRTVPVAVPSGAGTREPKRRARSPPS